MNETHAIPSAPAVWREVVFASRARALPVPVPVRGSGNPPASEVKKTSLVQRPEEPQTIGEDRIKAAFDDGLRTGLAQARQDLEQRVQTLAASLSEQRIAQAQSQADAKAKEQIELWQASQTQQGERLIRLLEQIPAALERAMREAEDQLVGLAHQATCLLIGQEAASPQTVRSQVRQALRDWQGRGSHVGIHLHPQDLEALKSACGDADILHGIDQAHENLVLRWVADPDIVLGGCLVQSQDGTLDARLQAQWEELKSRLLRVRAAREAGESS